MKRVKFEMCQQGQPCSVERQEATVRRESGEGRYGVDLVSGGDGDLSPWAWECEFVTVQKLFSVALQAALLR